MIPSLSPSPSPLLLPRPTNEVVVVVVPRTEQRTQVGGVALPLQGVVSTHSAAYRWGTMKTSWRTVHAGLNGKPCSLMIERTNRGTQSSIVVLIDFPFIPLHGRCSAIR